MSEMHWGVLGGPDRLRPGLMTPHSGICVPWPGRGVIACVAARLLGAKLVRQVEEFLSVPADPPN